MIKNIIFDWSGVINDNALTIYKIVIIMFKKLAAREISFEEFKREWNQPYMRFYNKYLPGLTIEEEQEAYRWAYQKVISGNPPKPYSGIGDILKKLKQAGIKMIVISSDFRETILKEVELFGLQGLFLEINDNIHDKSQTIQGVLERNNLNPKETIFIGDTTHEIESGKSAGTMTAAVTWGFQNEDKLKSAEPDFIIHNLEELEEIIL